MLSESHLEFLAHYLCALNSFSSHVETFLSALRPAQRIRDIMLYKFTVYLVTYLL